MSTLAELQRHLDAQCRLIQELMAQVDGLLAIHGPDAATRRKMLGAASTVLDPGCSDLEKAYAATNLALLVQRNIPAPRPVAVPLPVVSVEKENEAC